MKKPNKIFDFFLLPHFHNFSLIPNLKKANRYTHKFTEIFFFKKSYFSVLFFEVEVVISLILLKLNGFAK